MENTVKMRQDISTELSRMEVLYVNKRYAQAKLSTTLAASLFSSLYRQVIHELHGRIYIDRRRRKIVVYIIIISFVLQALYILKYFGSFNIFFWLIVFYILITTSIHLHPNTSITVLYYNFVTTFFFKWFVLTRIFYFSL